MILSAIGAALLVILSSKKPGISSNSVAEVVKATDQLGDKIEAIQAKTDEEIIAEAPPAQQAAMTDVVKEQVAEAMLDAEKFKRKKKVG